MKLITIIFYRHFFVLLSKNYVLGVKEILRNKDSRLIILGIFAVNIHVLYTCSLFYRLKIFKVIAKKYTMIKIIEQNW